MKKETNFFERLCQILEHYDIKSVNSFAINYLKYDSPEKINRLKKPNTNPSYDILCDIANKFELIDMNWLLLGKGNMLKDEAVTPKPEIKVTDQTSFNYLLDRYEKLAIENGKLTTELNAMKSALKKDTNSLPYINNK